MLTFYGLEPMTQWFGASWKPWIWKIKEFLQTLLQLWKNFLVEIKAWYSADKKCGTLHDFACHPCAGAMLIFSVSFQF